MRVYAQLAPGDRSFGCHHRVNHIGQYHRSLLIVDLYDDEIADIDAARHERFHDGQLVAMR